MRQSSRAPKLAVLFFAVLCLAAVPAAAHVERPSYFPDPAPDTSVTPAAGGVVPKARSLRSSLWRKPAGRTRVVCQSDSIKRLKASIAAARRSGYALRPSDRRSLSRKQGRKLLAINKKLKKRCKFSEINPAVAKSKNNDRVVVMPGLYTEPTARAQKTNDPACDKYRTNGDRPGEEKTALSFAYQFNCPNDQNLIAVIGHTPGSGEDPIPPREDRHGIPNLGSCIRCNLQLEGSGVSPDDVIVDAGDPAKGNGGPNGVGAKKDVAIRADRADGFVLRNVTVRHAGEHGIYVLETDGYRLDRFKAFFSRLYGTLTFTSDHGLQQNCEAAGHGDSGLYPGGAPETGAQRPAGTDKRFNQELRFCDLHHNLAGFSGTNGNAVHIHHNQIYDNSLGITTDVVTGAGHPGYPGDSAMWEMNMIHSNNFNTYAPDSDVKPSFPFPVGTGLWIAGGNHHTVRGNYFYDNWRRGTMIFSVPDSLVCGEANGGNQQAGCDSTKISTSHYNQTYDNHMGITPEGKVDQNGIDFWWDNFVGARGNCWYRNSGPQPLRTSPASLPNCDDGKDPALSIGTGNPQNEGELVSCVAAFESRDFDEGSPCPWLTPPSDPGDGQASPSAMNQPFAAPAPPPGPATQDPIPLGILSCEDWNRTPEAERAELVQRLRGFAGGVVNDGTRNLGTGAVLAFDEANALYTGWCSKAYAQGFLLYKLYTHAAAFGHRHVG
jgi:hypothetical protein